MTVEHHVPQSHDPGKRNEYSNCLYACRFCNRARSNKPVVDDAGRRLLDPSRDSWGDHFFLSEGEIHLRKGGENAAYTHQAYDLDDPRKVERRRFRREHHEKRQRLCRSAEEMERLLAKASDYRDADRDGFYELIDTAAELRQCIKISFEELSWYAAIPVDAPSSCRCGDTKCHSLPPGLARQMIDLETHRG